jgi:hypothetical protein
MTLMELDVLSLRYDAAGAPLCSTSMLLDVESAGRTKENGSDLWNR